MSATDLALLQPHLRPVALELLKDPERPNRRIETVYFMEAGIASVVAVQPDKMRIEIGLIGREGMSGTPVVLGGGVGTVAEWKMERVRGTPTQQGPSST